ncbi:hypothetical protein VTL71DRAFT_1369 [Oculimacula yallundae]|uniref:Uncharacterized protein n=1 Tax=Oculimacula yallundae TaxID=86028 RepID=A0ABR4CAH6_9HELO
MSASQELSSTSFTNSSTLPIVAKPRSISSYERLPPEIRQMITGLAMQEEEEIEYAAPRNPKYQHKGIHVQNRTTQLNVSAMAATSLTMHNDVKAVKRKFYELNDFKLHKFDQVLRWLNKLTKKEAESVRSLSTVLPSPREAISMIKLAPNLKILNLDVTDLVVHFHWTRNTNPDIREFKIMVPADATEQKLEFLKGTFKFLLHVPQLENIYLNMSNYGDHLESEENKEYKKRGIKSSLYVPDSDINWERDWNDMLKRFHDFKRTELLQFEELLRMLVRLPKEDRDLDTLIGEYVSDSDSVDSDSDSD